MSGALRGFAELRTRPITPEEEPQPKRICPKCGKTVLSRSNPGPLCRPCEFGHIEISDHLEALLEGADRYQLQAIAAAVAPQHVKRRTVHRPVHRSVAPPEFIPQGIDGEHLREVIIREFGSVSACARAMGWANSTLRNYWTPIAKNHRELSEWRRQALNQQIALMRARGGEK